MQNLHKAKYCESIQEVRQYIPAIQVDRNPLTAPKNNIERINDFKEVRKYEECNQPVILNGLSDKWSINMTFLNQFQEEYFRIGIDDDGDYLKIKLRDYLLYMKTTNDSMPLYLFDGDLNNSILESYQVPECFQFDLLSLLGSDRPQFRWILLGPQNSGSIIHQDPYETCAWNTIITGRKRWILFPPMTDKRILIGSIPHHFFNIEVNSSIDFIQEAGETVFVPNGWWHAVLNIEESLAVTQNYVAESQFDKFWLAFNKENPRLSYKLLTNLSEQLKTRALQINQIHSIQYNQFQLVDNQDSAEEDDDLQEFQNDENFI